MIPEAILSSTAKRTRQTVEYFLEGSNFDEEIKYSRNLYHGGTEEIIEMLQELDDKIMSAMIVGHNPGIETAVEDFCGTYERMPTSAIALVTFDIERWEDINSDIQVGQLWQFFGQHR